MCNRETSQFDLPFQKGNDHRYWPWCFSIIYIYTLFISVTISSIKSVPPGYRMWSPDRPWEFHGGSLFRVFPANGCSFAERSLFPKRHDLRSLAKVLRPRLPWGKKDTYIYPRAPVVPSFRRWDWGWFRGSEYLLRRYDCRAMQNS